MPRRQARLRELIKVMLCLAVPPLQGEMSKLALVAEVTPLADAESV